MILPATSQFPWRSGCDLFLLLPYGWKMWLENRFSGDKASSTSFARLRKPSPNTVTIQRLPRLQCNSFVHTLKARKSIQCQNSPRQINPEVTSQMQPEPESELDKLPKSIRESENILREHQTCSCRKKLRCGPMKVPDD
jgi:hypothetical protein